MSATARRCLREIPNWRSSHSSSISERPRIQREGDSLFFPRESEEDPEALLDALGTLKAMTVADIGAGSGYFVFRLAQRVGTAGRVLAVDIQDPGLAPESVDLALLVDVYHEFSHPWEMIRGIHRALKPGGRLVLVEYRAEDPTVPILRLHKMSLDQVRREISAHPLVWVETLDLLPRQHIVIFQKPTG